MECYMSSWRQILCGAFACAVVGVLSPDAHGAPLSPQVDFRSDSFSSANNQHSVSGEVDGVGFTVSAYRLNDVDEMEEALLWWDALDGLGIRGGEEDEIDGDERLVITFDTVVGLSDLFFSDLFAGEGTMGSIIDEAGTAALDSDVLIDFSADQLLATDGNKANGEHVLSLSKVEPVLSITLSASDLGHDFALVGFTDPPLNNNGGIIIETEVKPPVGIPVPGTSTIFVLGLLLLAVGTAFGRHRVVTVRDI